MTSPLSPTVTVVPSGRFGLAFLTALSTSAFSLSVSAAVSSTSVISGYFRLSTTVSACASVYTLSPLVITAEPSSFITTSSFVNLRPGLASIIACSTASCSGSVSLLMFATGVFLGALTSSSVASFLTVSAGVNSFVESPLVTFALPVSSTVISLSCKS